jgi:3-oxoacyl-ACP reductase-like protein
VGYDRVHDSHDKKEEDEEEEEEEETLNEHGTSPPARSLARSAARTPAPAFGSPRCETIPYKSGMSCFF